MVLTAFKYTRCALEVLVDGVVRRLKEGGVGKKGAGMWERGGGRKRGKDREESTMEYEGRRGDQSVRGKGVEEEALLSDLVWLLLALPDSPLKM